jgi:peptide/nickel transport system substrate-binding protein
MLPLWGGVSASVLETGNSSGESEHSIYRASSERFRYPARDYSEQSEGTPGGTLKVSVASDTGSLDLHSISHTNAEWLARILYDNLVYLDEEGKISPWLAKSRTISSDGKSYTFHLRDDVTLSDGTKFNAEAVLVNLEHMRDPATKSPLAAAYIDPYVDGKILDEYTVQLNLREPFTPFLNVLAQSWLSIEAPKAIREKPKELGETPVGCCLCLN